MVNIIKAQNYSSDFLGIFSFYQIHYTFFHCGISTKFEITLHILHFAAFPPPFVLRSLFSVLCTQFSAISSQFYRSIGRALLDSTLLYFTLLRSNPALVVSHAPQYHPTNLRLECQQVRK